MAQIRIQNLRKEFGSFTAVQSSTFTVEDREFFMLLGPSGCGKTTTLRMMAGLELPTSGQVFIDGEEVGMKPASQRDIAFVFQMFALYPHLNVRRNIAYPLVSQGMDRKAVRTKVEEVARILGIEAILDRSVGALSAGDRQRVALGRAIVREPKAFLMDEPLGALDAEFREHMAQELRALHERMGATTVYVTHDQLEAMQMGDRIVVMNHGVVEQYGVPQAIYDWPATLFVAGFIGSPPMNVLPFDGAAQVGAEHVLAAGHRFDIPRLLEGAQGALVLGVRPEHVHLRDDSSFRAQCVASEYLGATRILTLACALGELKVRVAANVDLAVGENVGIALDARTLTVFDAASGRALRSEANQEALSHG